MMNCINNDIVLVPGCLLCPFYKVNYSGISSWRTQWLSFLQERQVAIIQMPCPESSFGSYSEGLKRTPHGIRYYEKLHGFKEHCDKLALDVVLQILALEDSGYSVKAIIGIENSPTCAVSRIFTYGVGTEHRQGLFIEALNRYLAESQMTIPFIGINPHKKCQENEILKLSSKLSAVSV